MLRYRLPDGRSWKRLWEGWVGSFTMLLVLLEHRARMRMDETHLSVFHSVSNCARGKRSRNSISSAARISSRFFFFK